MKNIIKDNTQHNSPKENINNTNINNTNYIKFLNEEIRHLREENKTKNIIITTLVENQSTLKSSFNPMVNNFKEREKKVVKNQEYVFPKKTAKSKGKISNSILLKNRNDSLTSDENDDFEKNIFDTMKYEMSPPANSLTRARDHKLRK